MTKQMTKDDLLENIRVEHRQATSRPTRATTTAGPKLNSASESPQRKRWPLRAVGLQSGRVFIRRIVLFGPKEIPRKKPACTQSERKHSSRASSACAPFLPAASSGLNAVEAPTCWGVPWLFPMDESAGKAVKLLLAESNRIVAAPPPPPSAPARSTRVALAPWPLSRVATPSWSPTLGRRRRNAR